MNLWTLKFKNSKVEELYNRIHLNSYKKCIKIVLYGSTLLYIAHFLLLIVQHKYMEYFY